MKKKNLVAICVTAAIGLSITGCGSSSTSTTGSTTNTSDTSISTEITTTDNTTSGTTEEPNTDSLPVKGATTKWGQFTFSVPASVTFKGGDVFDENDTRVCSLKVSDFKYFEFKTESEDIMKQKYEYNKSTYTTEQSDISETINGINWTGFQYSDGWGGYGFELYTTVNNTCVRVSSAGYKFDDDLTKSILENFSVSAPEEVSTDITESTTSDNTETSTDTSEATIIGNSDISIVKDSSWNDLMTLIYGLNVDCSDGTSVQADYSNVDLTTAGKYEVIWISDSGAKDISYVIVE